MSDRLLEGYTAGPETNRKLRQRAMVVSAALDLIKASQLGSCSGINLREEITKHLPEYVEAIEAQLDI